MFNFEGQSIIVTGGTRGIGKAVARAFLKASANVVVSYSSDDEAAEKFKSENASFGNKLDIQKIKGNYKRDGSV